LFLISEAPLYQIELRGGLPCENRRVCVSEARSNATSAPSVYAASTAVWWSCDVGCGVQGAVGVYHERKPHNAVWYAASIHHTALCVGAAMWGLEFRVLVFWGVGAGF